MALAIRRDPSGTGERAKTDADRLSAVVLNSMNEPIPGTAKLEPWHEADRNLHPTEYETSVAPRGLNRPPSGSERDTLTRWPADSRTSDREIR
jgi:hypothetical protein